MNYLSASQPKEDFDVENAMLANPIILYTLFKIIK